MKKLVSIILSVLLLLPVIASFGVSAESIDSEYYAELLKQKEEFFATSVAPSSGASHFNSYVPLISPSLLVLLYTDIADELTIVKKRIEGDGILSVDENWFELNNGNYLASPEISEATAPCRTGSYGIMEARCALRECVKYFDISKDELLQAYETMEENPDAIRSLLTCLSDDEYESRKNKNGVFGYTPPNYMIEALYIEDDALAHRLFCDQYAVYVKEFGHVITAYEVFHTWPEEEVYAIESEQLSVCDLTGEEFAEFFAYCRNVSIPKMEGADHEAAYNKLAYLESVREAQLQAKQTGDGALTSVIVLALAAPALVWVRKKRKI